MVRQSAISGTPGRAASSPGGRGTRPAIRAAVASLLLLGACESGGSGSDDDAAVDAAEGVDGSGKPGGESDDGLSSAAGLRFVVAEDNVLEGVLVDATRPGETGSGPFGIASASSRGTLELLPDGRSFRYTPQADFNGTDGFELSDVTADAGGGATSAVAPDAAVGSGRPLTRHRPRTMESTLRAISSTRPRLAMVRCLVRPFSSR